MLYACGVETYGSEGHLHDGTCGEGTDNGTDSHGAAKQRADQGSRAK